VSDIAVAPDSKSVYFTQPTSDPDTHELMPLKYGRLALPSLELIGTTIDVAENDVPRAIAVSPDGSLLAIGTRLGKLGIFDAKTNAVVHAMDQIDSRALAALAWTDDSKFVFAGGQDGVLRIYDRSGNEHPGEISLSPGTALTDIAFSPDRSQLLVSSESGEVFIVDIASRTIVGVPLAAGGTQLQAVDISPDGKVVAATSRDGSIRVWDAASHRPIGPAMHAHRVDGSEILFNATGRSAMSFSLNDDLTVTLDMTPSLHADRACELAVRNLTRTEWDQYLPGKPYHATCPQFPDGT
jgi:WD40 repeat protein